MYIYGKIQPTTRALAEKLECRRGMRFTRIRKRRLIINWGRIDDFTGCAKVLNKNLIQNKLNELMVLRESGVNIPLVHSHRLAIRDGIEYPILGRDYNHTKGRDIIKYNNSSELPIIRDYYTQYIDKKGEYRVHVLGGEVKCITKKKRMEGENNDIIWNYNNGWKQVKYREDGRYWDGLADIGKRAVKALGYDFGAVDVIVEKGTEKLYVLEVNTAPGLIEDRVEIYADYFRGVNEEIT